MNNITHSKKLFKKIVFIILGISPIIFSIYWFISLRDITITNLDGNIVTEPKFLFPGEHFTITLPKNAAAFKADYIAIPTDINGNKVVWWDSIGVTQGAPSHSTNLMRYHVNPLTNEKLDNGAPVVTDDIAPEVAVKISSNKLLENKKVCLYVVLSIGQEKIPVEYNISIVSKDSNNYLKFKILSKIAFFCGIYSVLGLFIIWHLLS